MQSAVLGAALLLGALLAACAPAADPDNAIADLYAARQSGSMVEGHGRVAKLLSDDNDGARHQRFIVRLDSDLTVLIAHNIDIAPRIDDLERGDPLSFYGQYEWNDKGGVVHWTHHAPRGDHAEGWIEHRGRRYQ